jgi:hypothetical protein
MVSVSELSKPGRTTKNGDFAGQWRMRTRVQRVWDAPHAAWFSLMGIGGGLFILARLMGLSRELGLWFGLPAVDIVSFLAIGVGGVILLAVANTAHEEKKGAGVASNDLFENWLGEPVNSVSGF